MPSGADDFELIKAVFPFDDLGAQSYLTHWLHFPGEVQPGINLLWLLSPTKGRVAQADNAGNLLVNANAGVISSNVVKPVNVLAINPEATIWTPATGRRFRLRGWLLTASVAGNILLRDNTAGTLIAVVPIGTAGVAIAAPDLGQGIPSLAPNNVLTATGPAASTGSGIVFGTEE
jgi:hypothetical protein